MDITVFDALQAARQAKQPVAMVTDLASGGQCLLSDDGQVIGASAGAPDLTAADIAAVLTRLGDDRSGRLDDAGLFVHVHSPAPRLLIVGAVHISQALAPMAAIAGYAVSIIDPRGSFATEARFPGVTLIDEWPDEAMDELDPDRRTAVVTLTHDPKLDDPALLVALRSPAFYITALGSRRTHAKRIDRLTKAGLSADHLARLHAPAGLDIGAVSPAEIAVSIMAEMTAVRHRRPTRMAAD